MVHNHFGFGRTTLFTVYFHVINMIILKDKAWIYVTYLCLRLKDFSQNACQLIEFVLLENAFLGFVFKNQFQECYDKT